MPRSYGSPSRGQVYEGDFSTGKYAEQPARGRRVPQATNLSSHRVVYEFDSEVEVVSKKRPSTSGADSESKRRLTAGISSPKQSVPVNDLHESNVEPCTTKVGDSRTSTSTPSDRLADALLASSAAIVQALSAPVVIRYIQQAPPSPLELFNTSMKTWIPAVSDSDAMVFLQFADATPSAITSYLALYATRPTVAIRLFFINLNNWRKDQLQATRMEAWKRNCDAADLYPARQRTQHSVQGSLKR